MRLTTPWIGQGRHVRTWHRRPPLRRQELPMAGFSLIETLIVIAVAFVLTATSLITLTGVQPRLRADAAANQVVREIRRARVLAISERRTTQIVFSAGNQIQLLQKPAGGGPPVPLPSDPAVPLEGGAQFIYLGTTDTPMSFGTCSSGLCFTSSSGLASPATQFLADGTFSQVINDPVNGTIFLGIPGNPATARAITILGATGRVRLYKWNGKSWQE